MKKEVKETISAQASSRDMREAMLSAVTTPASRNSPDAESTTELPRLITQGRITIQAMGGPFSGLTHEEIVGLHTVLMWLAVSLAGCSMPLLLIPPSK